MKRIALLAAVLIAAVAAAGDSLHYTLSVAAETTAPTTSTQGVSVNGVQGITVTLADYRDGGAGDSDTITNCAGAAYLWTVYTSSAFSGQTGVWTRAPQLDVTCVNNDAGTNGIGQTFTIAPAVPLVGRLYYTVPTFTGADAGTPVADVTIQTY